jgi:CheY-like chemotaxis protein
VLHLPRAAAALVMSEASVTEDLPLVVSARVLLVEDDLEVKKVATELLQHIGCQVVQAHDGESALALLERDRAIELVVSDIAMPGGVSELELARIVRERYPGLPIVLATAYSQCAAQAMNEAFRSVENLMIAIGWPPQFGQSWHEPLVYRAHPNQPHRRWECVNVSQKKTTKGASIESVISAVFRLSFSIPSPRCPCPGLVPSGAAGTRKPKWQLGTAGPLST